MFHSKIIGIDPDLHKSGFCVMKSGKVIEYGTASFFDLIRKFDADSVIAIEDVNSISTTFGRKANQRQMLKIAQNVGMVKGVAKLIHEAALMSSDLEPVMISPRKILYKQAKKNHEVFAKLARLDIKRSNSEVRDAWRVAITAWNMMNEIK